MLIEVQKLVDGKPVPRGRVFIGQYGSDPYLNQSTAVYTDSSYTKPISAIGGIQLDYDGFPIDDNGQRVNLYTPNAYSIQLFTKYGNAIFPTWRDVQRPSGFDPANVYDFTNGITANGVKIGQDVTVAGLGTVKTPFSYIFSNADDGGTIDIQNYEVKAGSDAEYIATYSVKQSDSSLWDVGDSYNHYDMELFDANVGNTYSQQYLNVTKTATGLNVSRGTAITDGVSNASLNFAIVDGLPSLDVRKDFDNSTNYEIPIDGRIKTIEVTASRTLTNTDLGQILIVTGSTDVTLTIPAGLQKGFNCIVKNQTTANTVTIAADTGATVNNKDSQFNIELNGHAEILPTLVADTYDLVGDTVV